MSPKPSSHEKDRTAELVHTKHLAPCLVQSEGAACSHFSSVQLFREVGLRLFGL